MADWYRSPDWSDAISAEFERRLARARAQNRAQYLSLQGYALLGRHPEAASELLSRAAALEDPLETPRALAFLALARFALGDVDGGLAAYERGLEWQAETRSIVAVHAADYLFAVGYFERKDRLDTALPLAEALPDESLFGPDPQFLAGRALVFAMAGRDQAAREAALQALPFFDQIGAGTALGIDMRKLRERLATIAGDVRGGA